MDTKLDNTITQQAQTEILRAIASIQFGSVEIVIHNGQITQIEYREKSASRLMKLFLALNINAH